MLKKHIRECKQRDDDPDINTDWRWHRKKGSDPNVEQLARRVDGRIQTQIRRMKRGGSGYKT
jgi:hypothetical protein